MAKELPWKLIAIIAVVIIVLIVGYYMYSRTTSPLQISTPSAQSNTSSAVGTDGSASTVTPASTPATAAQLGLYEVKIENFAFSPAELTIKAGSKVTWTNFDSTPHAIVSDSGGDGGIGSGMLEKGVAYGFVFEQPGVYNYHCSIHTSMRGKVIVE